MDDKKKRASEPALEQEHERLGGALESLQEACEGQSRGLENI